MRQDKFDAVRFFERHIEKSVGCTEPAAVALASSIAFNAIRGKLPSWLRERKSKSEGNESGGEAETGSVSVFVELDRGTFKNALNAGIPHTGGRSGVSLAAALGIFCEPEAKLALFSGLSGDRGREKLRSADALLKAGRVRVVPDYEKEEIFILARVRTSEGEGECLIKRLHSAVVSVRANGNVLFEACGGSSESSNHEGTAGMEEDLSLLARMRVEDFISIVERLTAGAKKRLRDALETNRKAFEEAAATKQTACSFNALREMREAKEWRGESEGKEKKDAWKEKDAWKDSWEWVIKSSLMVGTAVEGRMSGLPMEVMTCAGSGNMGLTVSLPFVALKACETWDEKKEERLLKAFALSHLVANFASLQTRFISAICGCAIKAGVGLSAGIAYYLAASEAEETERAEEAEEAEGAEGAEGMKGGLLLRRVRRGRKAGVLEEVVKRAINNMISDITGVVCEGASRKCALKASTAVISAAKSAIFALNGVEFVGGIVEADPNATLRNLGEIERAMRETDKKITKFLEMQHRRA
ncbi:MAG: L-serine ammonia-lyase, iron-sulfur-dependent, subunit alpha [Candidatus Methanospirare jalkutatii]|nr:L-serine ammonia-lyase, iron-sulfur-dependent, subunit alpha [Candidatus Methanospirare jalkutatii]